MQGRVLKIILFIVFVLGPGLASWADIYVWEDEHGVKHFSNDGSAQEIGNVTVHDEVTWSADDEEQWKREKTEGRLKHDRQMVINQKIADDQAMKKKACLEAKAAYEQIKRKYAEFSAESLPHYGHLPENEVPGVIREKRAIRKRNQERREQWEKDKKQAFDAAEQNIERCCK